MTEVTNLYIYRLVTTGLAQGYDKEQIIGFIMLGLNLFYEEAKELVEISLKEVKT